jgi:type II secretory pathway predicted ATPase ExeA
MVQEAAGVGRNKGVVSPTASEPLPAMIAPRRHPSSRPFLAAPRVDFYHAAKQIDAALHGLDRLVRRAEGIGLVVGPPGTGKSLLLAKVAESVRDDFDVALLSGARICTRRALWQSILAEIGEPYRGIDEAELRIGVVERIRGLAATGSGLVVLVDEATTLPTRLIEELRLLTNIPTPLPAVHIVLAATAELEEILGSPKLESLSQRIGGRFYLEPLDHAETAAFVRTQMRMASLDWESQFEPGCDDAVFTASDGVPRLINQICDLALVLVAEAGRTRVAPTDIVAAWQEIQRLPAPAALAQGSAAAGARGGEEPVRHAGIEFPAESGADSYADGMGVIEFGTFGELAQAVAEDLGIDDTILEQGVLDEAGHAVESLRAEASGCVAGADPWHGPEVELVFDPYADPFEEYFEQEERVVERFVMRGPDDFSSHAHVSSREGLSMARQLDACELPQSQPPMRVATAAEAERPIALAVTEPSADVAGEPDDSDMVVIEEDLVEHPADIYKKSIFTVRPGDYRSLFARLRRGDK